MDPTISKQSVDALRLAGVGFCRQRARRKLVGRDKGNFTDLNDSFQGQSPGRLPSPAQRAGFSGRSSLGATPRSFAPIMASLEMAGALPFSNLCTNPPSPLGWARQTVGASPLNPSKCHRLGLLALQSVTRSAGRTGRRFQTGRAIPSISVLSLSVTSAMSPSPSISSSSPAER